MLAMSAVAKRDHATSGSAHRNNLPRYLTSFVGRLPDLKTLSRLLAMSRLITLTGPGGSGKTRLAVQVAETSRKLWRDGVWWVDLASIDDPARVPSALAAALGLPRLSSMTDAVTSSLGSRQCLVLLDTCEHVLPGCAEICDLLIQRCPDVTIIATSREPLGIAGEALFPVAPLPDTDAAALFEHRARLTDIEFKLGATNRGVVSEICERLDGMPLAIELAAARLGMMSEREILSRLADRFELLASGARTLPRRQQTMAGAIDWSYRLLPEDEAQLFRRLSVFHGGFSLEAAEIICGEASGNILNLLSNLIQRSLVLAQKSDQGSTRYRLLDSMQVYAEEKLRHTGEIELVCGRHYDYFASALTSHVVHTWGKLAAEISVDAGDEDWKARESANLWAALNWARDNVDDRGLTLAYLMAESQHGDLPRINALLIELAETSAERGLERVKALERACSISLKLGQRQTALRLAQAEFAAAKELGDHEAIAKATSKVGQCRLELGELDAALALNIEALELLKGTGNQHAVFHARYLLAWTELERGKAAAAVEALASLVSECRSLNSVTQLSWYLTPLGWSQMAMGDHDAAAASFHEGMNMARRLRDHWDIVLCLEGISALACARSDDVRALRIAAAAARTSQDWSLSTVCSAKMGNIVQKSRERLGKTRSEEAWNAGWDMSVDRAMDYATFDESTQSVPDAGPLSKRERLVARLVAAGMTNRQIAKELFLSERTVEGHVERIRNKLEVRSRTDVAVWAVEHGLASRHREA